MLKVYIAEERKVRIPGVFGCQNVRFLPVDISEDFISNLSYKAGV
jgi:hypothetical protein